MRRRWCEIRQAFETLGDFNETQVLDRSVIVQAWQRKSYSGIFAFKLSRQ